MTPEFNTADSSTWPVVLTLREVAAIFRRKPGGVAKSIQQGRFVPAPFEVQPYRWRRADVLRRIEAGRMTSGIRRAG